MKKSCCCPSVCALWNTSIGKKIIVAVTGILIGISGGAAVGGWAIEAWGAQRAYAVPILAGAAALAIIVARFRHVQRAELAASAEA